MPSDLTSSATGTTAPLDFPDVTRRLLEESFNEGNFTLIDQFVAPDCFHHDPGAPAALRDPRGPRGPEQVKLLVSGFRAAFPDVQVVVDDVIAADDKVALRWHSVGTHGGELEGLAPTGLRASVTGISIDYWKDGKIIESWSEWDNLGLARQIGALPPEAAA